MICLDQETNLQNVNFKGFYSNVQVEIVPTVLIIQFYFTTLISSNIY